jgi:hypothetical protein
MVRVIDGQPFQSLTILDAFSSRQWLENDFWTTCRTFKENYHKLPIFWMAIFPIFQTRNMTAWWINAGCTCSKIPQKDPNECFCTQSLNTRSTAYVLQLLSPANCGHAHI